MNYFYDIAVYRLEEEKYYRELKEYKNTNLFGSNESIILCFIKGQKKSVIRNITDFKSNL